MGKTWDSEAEVISLEPEKIKQLIEEIIDENKKSNHFRISSVHDLRIEDNSVFFNSGGYGCYGYDAYYIRDYLFEILLERYEGAIACFEYVQPCQSQNFYFAVTYIKSETEQSTHLFVFVMEEDEDYDVRTDESHWDYVESSSYPYPSFDREEVFIWAIPTWLEDNSSLVSLNSIYKKCGNNELKITHSLINSWWDDGAISEDEYYSALEESKSYCVESLKDSWSLLFEEFESSLPSNFPSFKTK